MPTDRQIGEYGEEQSLFRAYQLAKDRGRALAVGG